MPLGAAGGAGAGVEESTAWALSSASAAGEGPAARAGNYEHEPSSCCSGLELMEDFKPFLGAADLAMVDTDDLLCDFSRPTPNREEL